MLKKNKLSAIVAIDLNFGIGYKDKILFKNDMDMFVFKTYTSIVKECLVGRITFDSLPTIIQKTRNLNVLTRQDLHNSKINLINDVNKDLEEKHYVVIGGSKVYDLLHQDISTWIITTHKQVANNVDAWFDKKIFDYITTTCNVINLYENNEIKIDIYIKR